MDQCFFFFFNLFKLTLQLLSGPVGARSQDMTSKRQRRKQRVQLHSDVPVKTEPPQVQVRNQ